MISRRFLRLCVLLCGIGFLSACEDSEVAAERYYQSAVQLAEDGDVDRALVELRNVFEYDGFHREARMLYADLSLRQGNTREAYGQYLRVIEQYPETVEVRRVLAELAVASGNWDEVERHGSAAIEQAPDVPAHEALAAAIAYRKAMLDRSDPEAAAAADAARALLEENPDLIVARRVLIDWLVQGPDPALALPHIDIVLDAEPNSYPMHKTRLSLLSQQGDDDAVEAQLRRMYELFPESEEVSGYLIGWYLSKENFEAAEAFLREQAGPDDSAPEGHMAVVQLIGRQAGAKAARAELDRLAAANADTDTGRFYSTEAASLRFQAGEREEALAEVKALVAGSESLERRLSTKMTLARMQAAMGEREAALTVVNEILEEDPRYVDALKIRAEEKIRENDFGSAVSDLRAALDQNPTDADILMLLADAQQKAGNLELAQQQLAQAVEVSNAAPRPSVVYAKFLIGQERLSSAETVLANAHQASPGNLEIAGLLGKVLLQRGRLAEASDLVRQLEQAETAEAMQMAQALQASILFRQNRVDESLSFLQSQIGNEEGDLKDKTNLASTLQLLRLQVMSNRLDEARDTVDDLTAQFPGSQAVRVLQADLLAVEGNTEEALAAYRAILEDNPDALVVVERTYRALMQTGEADQAEALVREALERMPDARSLRLIEAGRLERENDIDGAIAIYQSMYDQNPNDLIAANNLASLLSLHREDSDNLDRAYQIALRLTGAKEPAFQDTLGWVQLQRGAVDQAVQNLQAAARGLSNNATVAVNLGMAYAAAGRTEEARAELERAMDLAGPEGSAQAERARAALKELETDP